MADNRICGECKHIKKDYEDRREFYCSNENSDCYGCRTTYNESCEDYEEKE